MTNSINAYLQVRNVFAPRIRADGKKVAFLTDITGIPQIWQVEIHPEVVTWADQLTFGANRVVGHEYSPVPNDDRIVYSRDVGGDENMQLFLLDSETGDEQLLTAGHEDAMHLFGEWSADGNSILFAANRRDKGLFDLYVQSLNGDAQLIWQNDDPGYLFYMTFSPDGGRVALTHMISSFADNLLEIDIQSGTAHTIRTEARYRSLNYSADGKSLYLITDWESDFTYLAQLDLASGDITRLASPDWDVVDCTLSPDKQTLAYTLNVEGASELYRYDIATGESHQLTLPAEHGIMGFTKFSADSKQLVSAFISATRASDAYLWDIEKDTVRPLSRTSHGGLDTSTFVSPELIHYPTFDTNESGETRHIPAWLYKPETDSDNPRPVIVIVHGGPEGQSRPIFSFTAQYFVNQGYAVMLPNVRGSVGYGKAYSHLDDVEKRMDSVADLAHAAHWLKAQPDIDENKIVVYGGSYGGFMVLSAMTTYPDLWVAGVNIVGISNFVTFLENTSDYRRAHREAEYGSLAKDRDFLESISPINHIDNIQAPLMVIHGANDPRVPLSEAEQLAEALESRDIPVELLVFDDEGHGIVKLKNKQVAYPAIADFLSQVLT